MLGTASVPSGKFASMFATNGLELSLREMARAWPQV